jgi:hypothetical protein
VLRGAAPDDEGPGHDEIVVAEYRTNPALLITESPRPYLHPVRTLGGAVVTELHPEDHPHHMGVSVSITDVSGRTFSYSISQPENASALPVEIHSSTRSLPAHPGKSA